MCGIVGIIKKSSSIQSFEIEKMTNAIKHRGPDGSGVFISKNIGIGHRRLSIIDLDGGKQPLSNKDESLWITFNGEIYNYIELKNELLKKGHIFKTNSDTEVVIHAFEEWGENCLNKLRGMFAFGIIDLKKNELFLARDHFGIKPLVYAFSNEVFCFSSEIQALKKVEGLDWTINISALDQYLQFQNIPAPNTIFNNTYKLPPAHWMRVNGEGKIIEIKKYWQLQFKKGIVKNENEWAEELSAVIKESVKAHLVSDVPFGAFLSGGIDSSTVVGNMAELMNQPLKTFSIGFNEVDYNELKYAKAVSDYWNTEHYEEVVQPDALSILPELVKHYGEPFGDSSAIPTWYVSKLAKEHVTMVLTGDAADELFAGYESYTTRWNKHLNPIPEHLPNYKKLLYPLFNKIDSKNFAYRTSNLSDWLKYIHYFNDDSRNKIWKKEISNTFEKNNRLFLAKLFDETNSFSHFQKTQFLDFNTYMPGAVLTKVDVASMMNSLETRTPLLDINVVEFASTIPENLNIRKINGIWEGKLLLKKNLEKHFSKEFIYRKKMGFATPISDWFGIEGSKNKEVKERLLDPNNGFNNYFNKEIIEKIVDENNSGHKWLLLFLQEWFCQQ